MTSSEHPSGSDRVAEVASGLEADIIVNVQGDEPFITADVLKPLLDSFLDGAVQMASLMTPILDAEQLDDPGIVKVVTDAAGKALYFSRSLIPLTAMAVLAITICVTSEYTPGAGRLC